MHRESDKSRAELRQLNTCTHFYILPLIRELHVCIIQLLKIVWYNNFHQMLTDDLNNLKAYPERTVCC